MAGMRLGAKSMSKLTSRRDSRVTVVASVLHERDFASSNRPIHSLYQHSSGTPCHVAWSTRSLPLAIAGSSSRRTHLTKAGRRSYSTPAFPDRSGDDFAIPRVPTRVLKALNSIMQATFGRRFEVVVFGSTCYGTDSADSDLDLCMLDHKKPNGTLPEMTAVAAALKTVKSLKRSSEPMFINVEAIPRALVPIVKFKDTVTGLSCDLNVNDRLGVVNTLLIRQYSMLSPLVRPMIYVIKYWARNRELNDSSAVPATPSSYAYALMTIAFLQMRSLLPNLQRPSDAEYPDPDKHIWFRRVTRYSGKMAHMKCDVRVLALDKCVWSRHADLVGSFDEYISYWASEHDYSRLAISVRDGGIVPKIDIVKRHSPEIDVDIEATLTSINELLHFVQPPCNLTASVSMRDFKKFKEECAEACKLLQEGLPIQQLCSHIPGQIF
ncbi:uncharacterized protein B0H18DRAFT_1014812, partial [Fomitopsis serialis]|uniref:uncharacterized protein n=1 Tax=Fomitopsis serialis TaxID=139415 RepID=UPI002007B27E